MYTHSLLRADEELQLKTESSLDLVRSRPDTVLHIHVVRRRQLGQQKTHASPPHPLTPTPLTTPAHSHTTHHTHSPRPFTTPTHQSVVVHWRVLHLPRLPSWSVLQFTKLAEIAMPGGAQPNWRAREVNML